MKKVFVPLLVGLLFAALLSGCATNDANNNMTFAAQIESVEDGSIMVVTSDDVGFDKASVGMSEVKDPPDLQPGEWVKITILPEIRESYPVQVTAVSVTPMTKEDVQAMQYRKISAEDAKDMMDDGNPVIILDVRTTEEFAEGHIKDALLLPDYEIETLAPTALPDKSARVLIYCRSGNRSEGATRKLIDMGYTNVYDFGGIIDWPYEIVKD